MTKKVLEVLSGKTLSPPPIWLMRQAGRFLPEYREVREKAGSFLDLCYNPQLSFEVTMQPIRRFGFDAAILFSDILVVPHALGRNLRFEEKKGPILDPLSVNEIKNLNPEKAQEKLVPSFETLSLLKTALPAETTLIGFCGAPWTVATYMIAGHGTPDQAPARLFGFNHPEAMKSLLELLADVSADYLVNQVKSGAEVLQIFDSWAGVLDEESFDSYVIYPIKRMVQRIRNVFPEVPIIGFPKGAGALYENFAQKTGVTALGLDWSVPLSFAKKLQKLAPVQGNLDPLRLVSGGVALEKGIENILENLGHGPLVFNLGHGITPQTPIKNVERLVKLVRNFNK
ncbi:uroporphyrinogen decarboxylase [uncultured Bartonella sp.]|uniref:uroporphyrinogen decarboxylase n=1 Tax=uncultured Bartonella sp. TaxID=104108 RepID=UPI0025D269DB|nr:uroporphyrinogen decarboxylase [uncultured Bartonella sp.]